jgi:hypothetical protein
VLAKQCTGAIAASKSAIDFFLQIRQTELDRADRNAYLARLIDAVMWGLLKNQNLFITRVDSRQ